ncbi:MAG: AraC family transcriptional regulator [Firmicutes bacterium]|nr:AraC family transcriptional regulator [Bacillota bacterium]
MIEYELERSESDNYYYCRIEKDLQHHTHMQSSFELVYLFEGELSVYIGANEYKLKKGDAVFVLPHQIHSYVTTKKSSYFLAIFSQSFVYDYYTATKGKSANSPLFRPSKKLVQELSQLNSKNIYQTKSLLYSLIHTFNGATTYADENLGNESFLKKTLNYIERNFMHEVSLEVLAKNLGYDYNYTSNLFNKVFKRPFLSFVNDYRINHAKHLLVNTEDSITYISSACGYDSIRSFNRNFIKLSGTTPTAYRDG